MLRSSYFALITMVCVYQIGESSVVTHPSILTKNATVIISTTKLLSRTSERFKCWNIDASPNRGFLWRNLSDPNILQLAKSLPAGYLRFGGGGNDALWYGVGAGNSCDGAAPRNLNCLNATMLHSLLTLAETADARLVFGLSIANQGCPSEPEAARQACLNRPGRRWGNATSWNSTNAEGLIRYLAARGQPFAFELGNEEDAHYGDGRGLGLAPADAAASFAELHEILARVYPNATNRPKIIGPDADYQNKNATTHMHYREWEEEFFGNISSRHVPLHAGFDRFSRPQSDLWSVFVAVFMIFVFILFPNNVNVDAATLHEYIEVTARSTAFYSCTLHYHLFQSITS
jgi:hypothetical protein